MSPIVEMQIRPSPDRVAWVDRLAWCFVFPGRPGCIAHALLSDSARLLRATHLPRSLGNQVYLRRLIAAQALQRIGPAARDAEPSLLAAARHGTPSLRAAALQALVANDAEPQPLWPVLAAALHDSAAFVRAAAVTSAPAARIERREALAMIIPLTHDQDAKVREAAYRSVGRLLGAPEVEAQARTLLLAAATNPDTAVRNIARRALTPSPVADTDREPRRAGILARPVP